MNITANLDHLTKAREYFKNNPKPKMSAVATPIIKIKGESKRYNGIYYREYHPVEGTIYVSQEENAEAYNPRPSYDNEFRQLYCYFDEKDQLLEMSLIFLDGSRPDRKLNIDKREWSFKSQHITRYYKPLGRVILFLNDPYAYFEDEKLNNEVGKYYNKALADRLYKSYYTISNLGYIQYGRVCNEMNKFLLANKIGKVSGIYDFIEKYKNLQPRNVSDKALKKKDDIDNFQNLLSTPDTSSWGNKFKDVEKEDHSLTNRSTYSVRYLLSDKYIVEKFDNNNWCIRKFRATDLYDKASTKTYDASYAKGAEYSVPGCTWAEHYRLFILKDQTVLFEKGPKGYFIRSNKMFNFMSYRTNLSHEVSQLDLQIFARYPTVMYSNKYNFETKIGLFLQLEKHSLARRLLIEGLFDFVEYAVYTKTDLSTVMKHIFNTKKTSEKLENFTSLSVKEIKDKILPFFKIREKSEKIISGAESTTSDMIFCQKQCDIYNTLCNFTTLTLDEQCKNQIKENLLSIDPSADPFQVLTTNSNYGYWTYRFKHIDGVFPMSPQEADNILKLLSQKPEDFKFLSTNIQAVRNTYNPDVRKRIADLNLDYYDLSKVYSNHDQLVGVGANFRFYNVIRIK